MPKVLVVDDNEDIRNLYCLLFERRGVRAKCFGTGGEVLDWLAIPDNRVSVILLDLAMFPLDGLTTAEEIRRNADLNRQNRNIDIAFLSGKDIDDAVLRIAERCRVRRIFSKSEQPQDIAEEIVSWLEIPKPTTASF